MIRVLLSRLSVRGKTQVFSHGSECDSSPASLRVSGLLPSDFTHFGEFLPRSLPQKPRETCVWKQSVFLETHGGLVSSGVAA